MSEVMIPWAPGAVYTRVLCRLGMPRPDTNPTDGNPELIPISGKVSLTANIASARYLESDARYRYLTFGTWEFSIRASDGELVNIPTGTIGVSILSGSSQRIEPEGFSWVATVKPAFGGEWKCVIPPDAVSPYDLVANMNVVPSPAVEYSLQQQINDLNAAIQPGPEQIFVPQRVSGTTGRFRGIFSTVPVGPLPDAQDGDYIFIPE